MYNLRNSRKDFLRSQNVARKRRKRRFIKISIKLAVLLLLIVALAWLSWISKLSIGNVVVVGNSSVEASELQKDINKILDGKYALIFSKRNAMIYPKKEIRELVLNNYPRVENVIVKTEGLNILNVLIEERKPLALWCTTPNCYLMDKNAFIYEKYEDHSASASALVSRDTSTSSVASSTSENAVQKSSAENDLVKFHGNEEAVGPAPIGKHAFDKKLFEEMFSTSKVMETLGFKVSDITYKEKNSITFGLKDNGRIIFSDKKSFEESLDNLKSALSSSAFKGKSSTAYNTFEYIDLRYGNKVFYRLSGKVEASSTIEKADGI